MSEGKEFERFVQIVKELRDPDTGCPWDLKQTHQTLIRFMVEECFEAVEAIKSENSNDLMDELGDVLLQVVLHSQLASESNSFSIKDVLQNISEKMIRRHPHVFSNTKAETEAEVKKNWEAIKIQENPHPPQKIKPKLAYGPALSCSSKIGEFTNKKGFDWSSPAEVMAKVNEELQELNDELKTENNSKRIQEEFGDLLFSMAQVGRHLGIDSEEALDMANRKFIKRYNQMIDLNDGDCISELSLDEKENLWKRVKENEA